MQKDLDGFVGHLDQLVPELMIKDRIYGEDRLSRNTKSKSVGNLQGEDEWSIQYLWWNSESQSNWWDGYLRHAFLLDDPVHLKKVGSFIDYILSTQDADGYIGIYAPDLRYQFTGENGELWSKATLYRVLLAYYDATGDMRVFQAVVKAVRNVMENYPINDSAPFKASRPYAGTAHGLLFTDILSQLWQLTGDEAYRDYIIFLFKDYSLHELSEKDVQLSNIFDEDYRHSGHGVHTYEHLRSLAAAFFASKDPELEKALSIYLERIQRSMTPSGGPIGDEWILGRDADANDTGYEYCSIQELMDSYLFLFQYQADPLFAELAEKIFLNAAQGARHPEHSSIAYLKTDNSFEMCGRKFGEEAGNPPQTRYKYSPAHQDVAVCCSPNAGRVYPYFVQQMWMTDEHGFLLLFPGPCELQTVWNGRKLTIRQHTSYPFDYSIRLQVLTDGPVTFALKIRKPAWSKKIEINTGYVTQEHWLVINKEWKNNQEIEIRLTPVLNTHTTPAGESYFSYGPLVLALPIPASETRTRDYPLPGFFDTHHTAEAIADYRYPGGPIIKKQGELLFFADLVDAKSGGLVKAGLVPMGKTLLRQISFKHPETRS
jgi:DUF1680 family protein